MTTFVLKDDGYRGLIRNNKTGQILQANKMTARNNNYERIKSPDQKPTVTTSKSVEKAEPEVTSTPDPEASTEAEDAGLALATLLAEAKACEDPATLKELGGSIGVKLTMNMNVRTMRERISAQADAILAAGA